VQTKDGDEYLYPLYRDLESQYIVSVSELLEVIATKFIAKTDLPFARAENVYRQNRESRENNTYYYWPIQAKS
jgi:hypothetical protein